ncbi:hypothetical protein [Methylomicrobium lacus]|uniref:hypothetical protein n=1 Tax=Methylomicrobium lacus TaxID=136992 RepID=UPI0004A229F7|nr:hypothetical protein [Methylomicrobium lacus]
MAKDEESSVDLTGDILNYLTEHPDAADTPEGIALWWMKRQRFEVSVKLVSVALEELDRRGLLDKTILADGTFLYRLSLSPKPAKFLQ